MKLWKTLKTTVIEENQFVTYKVDEFETATGARGQYYYHDGANACAVIGEFADGRLLYIDEFRYLKQKRSITHVAGAIDEGESPEEAARRELEEEAGYVAGRFIKLGQFDVAPALSTQIIHVFLATDLKKTVQALESTEDIIPIILSTQEIEAAILDGTMWNSNAMASYMLFQLYKKNQ